jgi:hypothetical protein
MRVAIKAPDRASAFRLQELLRPLPTEVVRGEQPPWSCEVELFVDDDATGLRRILSIVERWVADEELRSATVTFDGRSLVVG